MYRTLRRLAAPASEQVDYLTSLGVAPSADKLALELDDLLFLAPRLVTAQRIGAGQAQAIVALARQLEEMSGPTRAHLWTPEALCDSACWSDIRRLACRALRSSPETAGGV